MAFLPYLAYTLVGDAIWTTLLAFGGYALGRDYRLIAGYLHVFAWVLAAAGVVFCLGMWLRRHRRDGTPA
jgi:membrane protein DedA with SNARE-associated domain